MRNKSVVTPNILWCLILCKYDGDTKSMKSNFKLGLNSVMKFSIPSKYQCCNLIIKWANMLQLKIFKWHSCLAVFTSRWFYEKILSRRQNEKVGGWLAYFVIYYAGKSCKHYMQVIRNANISAPSDKSWRAPCSWGYWRMESG